MAVVGVTHKKVVTVPDDPNYPVGSDEWNDSHAVTGLENVDNTSDANKPVSTAQAVALALKAPTASPSFTGTATVSSATSAVAPPAFNFTPQTANSVNVLSGSDATPVTYGTTPTIYTQRVDQSTVADDAGHLMYLQYNFFKRLAGGTGWITVNNNLVEDASTSGAAQTVATNGVAHSIGNASVWGLYAEAHAHTTSSNAQGIESNAINASGSDFNYNYANPVAVKFTNAAWLVAFGTKRNSFALGIASGSTSNMWGAGAFFAANSIKDYGIDIQSTPSTLINFKSGASTDGTGATPGGIGLDTGVNALYGNSAHQGAIHLRNSRMVAGVAGTSYLQFVEADSSWKFTAVGTTTASIDAAGIFGTRFITTGTVTALALSTPTSGGVNTPAVQIGSNSGANGLGIFFGSGVPTFGAQQGSLYLRTDGSSASTRMYINTNGAAGWVNVVTAF